MRTDSYSHLFYSDIIWNNTRDSEGSFSLLFPLFTITLKPFNLPQCCYLLSIYRDICAVAHAFRSPKLFKKRIHSSSVTPPTVSRSQIQFLPEAQDDPQRRRPDIRKAKMMLGWEPVVCVTHQPDHAALHMNSEHPVVSATDGSLRNANCQCGIHQRVVFSELFSCRILVFFLSSSLCLFSFAEVVSGVCPLIEMCFGVVWDVFGYYSNLGT